MREQPRVMNLRQRRETRIDRRAGAADEVAADIRREARRAAAITDEVVALRRERPGDIGRHATRVAGNECVARGSGGTRCVRSDAEKAEWRCIDDLGFRILGSDPSNRAGNDAPRQKFVHLFCVEFFSIEMLHMLTSFF